MAQGPCWVCQVPDAEFVERDGGERLVVDCWNCGRFIITQLAVGLLKDDKSRAVLSHAIYRAQRQEERPEFDRDLVQQIITDRNVPRFRAQMNNLILRVGSYLEELGRTGGQLRKQERHLLAVVGAVHSTDVKFICRQLKVLDLINLNELPGRQPELVIGLTAKGWDEFYNLQSGRAESRLAFMAMQYGDAELDEMYVSCFKPAVEATGFELVRLDERPKLGVIDNHLRVEIRNARLLLADLSSANQGAYWESGFAEGLGRPVLYLCKKSVFDAKEKRPHFDTNHCQTVVWDPKNLDRAVQEIKDAIRATLPDEAKMSDD